MRALGLPLVALVICLAGCGGDDSTSTSPTVTATTTASPAAAPWLGSDAPAIDAAGIPSGQDAAWMVLDPESSERTDKAPVEGHVPQALAGGRYDLVATGANLARLDADTGTLTDIGAGWDGGISPDGKWAAVIPEVEGPTLAVVEVATGERFDLGQLGKPVELAWAPDDTLAIIKDGTLYLAAGPGWAPRSVGTFAAPRVTWSPDSQTLAAGEDGAITLYGRDLSVQKSLAPADGTDGTPLVWSPDGTRLAWGDAEGWWVVDVESGRRTNVSPVELGGGSLATAVWSPDGTELAFPVDSQTWGVHGIAVAKADGSGAHLLASGVQLQLLGWTAEGVVLRVFRGL